MPARILDMRAAMGGDDAARFCYELRRAYLRYAQRNGWEVEILDESAPDTSHVKSCTLRVAGKGVERLDVEAGTHRVTRIPSNERTGRRHTSAVTVAVLPVVKDVDVSIDEKDLRVDTFRGTGPGGQHRNKTDSAVRITHKPSGMVVVVQNDRSQITNRARAMEVLAARLQNQARTVSDRQHSVLKAKHHGSGNIAERQRSYLWRESVAVDHSSGVRVQLNKALDGDLGAFAV